MSAAVAVIETGTGNEEVKLRRQLKEAYEASRRIRVTLLGVKDDAAEAMGPVRLQRTELDLKNGLCLIQEQLDALEKILTRT